MPDPTLNDVMLEAYASASTDKVIIDTLSFYHDGMLNDAGQPDEICIFNGENATSIDENGVAWLAARIEANAAHNAGLIKMFTGIPFQLTLPPMDTNAITAAQLTVDSVQREGHDLLEAAAKGGRAVTVTYRTYILGRELDGPSSLPPRKFTLAGASGANASISGSLVFLPMGNRPYPFDTYRPGTFRTLQYAA